VAIAKGYASPAQAEYFSERNFWYERGVCSVTREGAIDAVLLRDRTFVAETRQGQSGEKDAIYHQTVRTAREHLHATSTWRLK